MHRLAGAQPLISGFSELTGELVYRRDLAAEVAKSAISSSRYRLLILNAVEWIEDGRWLNLVHSKHLGVVLLAIPP